jgi:hypothetical protein
MLQMMRGDFADLAAGSAVAAAKAQKGADVVERESKLARAPYKNKCAEVPGDI